MRKEVTWVSPLRTGIIYAAIFAVIYFAIGLIALIFGGFSGGMNEGAGAFGGARMMGGGLLGAIGGLIMGGIGGFIGGVIGAFVYNIAAGIVGGVVIELKDA